MKKTIIAIMLLCPTLSFAQNTWEVPTQKNMHRCFDFQEELAEMIKRGGSVNGEHFVKKQ